MSGNIPYIGSKISLITTSDIRYEGILYTLNREESTIAVQNVRSFGTEGRRVPEVPMSNEIYDFIIFRGKDLKDLTVLQGVPERTAQYPMGSMDFMDHGNSLYNHQAIPPAVDSFQQGAQQMSMGAFQRPSVGSTATARNGFAPAAASNGFAPAPAASNSHSMGAYPTPASSASRPVEKPFSGVHARQPYLAPEPPHPPPLAEHTRAPLYEDAYGVPSRRDASEDPVVKAQSRIGSDDAKDRTGEPKDKGARGRGKGSGHGGGKKQLCEVLRMHKTAEDTIVSQMRKQNSASLAPRQLRAMSEENSSVYHFYLDFVNYCCTSHMMQSDEQQWESLGKALKKQYEKEFGSNQNQKPPQPQRPNNTLGDFITIEASSKAAKKGVKPARGGGRVGGGPGRGRGEKKDIDGQGPGDLEGPGPEDAGAQSTSWVCPRCTLRNENFLSECAACQTSKQQAALWAEFPPLG